MYSQTDCRHFTCVTFFQLPTACLGRCSVISTSQRMRWRSRKVQRGAERCPALPSADGRVGRGRVWVHIEAAWLSGHARGHPALSPLEWCQGHACLLICLADMLAGVLRGMGPWQWVRPIPVLVVLPLQRGNPGWKALVRRGLFSLDIAVLGEGLPAGLRFSALAHPSPGWSWPTHSSCQRP